MCTISIHIPEEVFLALHEDKAAFADYMKKMVALDLYKNRKVSLGYCADIAEMAKEEFIRYLGSHEISIFEFDSENNFMEELTNA